MILHLCHHWFWITTLRLLLAMTVIARAEELGDTSEPEPGRTNTSHPPPVRSKFKAVLFNVTRLYPVLDIVPDRSHSSSSASGSELFSSEQDRQFSTDGPNDERAPSSDRQWSRLDRIDKTLFASGSIETRDVPRHPSDDEKPFSTPTSSAQSSSAQEAVATADNKELLSDSDSSLMNANQSERLEREIRKNNVTQTDVEHHPAATHESVKKISTTLAPLNNESIGEAYETEQGGYTIFVTPTSSYASSPNDLTTQTLSTPTTQSSSVAPVEVVKKSENVSKIKDKSAVELKTKYSSKTKDKTTPLKPVVPVKSSTSAGGTDPDVSTTTASTSSKPVQYLTSPTHVLTSTNINSSRQTYNEVMNDSPAVQENATELAFENTSISADYEEVNVTSPSSINISSISRTSSHARMLDVAPGPQAHAEVLSNPWASQGGQLNVAMISGISFGALALVTLLGAVSFIMYRRYRWNKPQTLSDKCSNPDSSGYIDDSTLRENSEEMYSLDNDSFLNSLEAMTIQNYWTDHVKHTKL